MNVKNRHEIYKCNICGNIIEVNHAGGGELVCCGKPMDLMTENTFDAAIEKHVPVVEKTEDGIKVSIGEVQHPMEEAHFIQWIEVITEEKSFKKFLKPGDKPKTEFCIKPEDIISVREYCNLHGLWKNSR